MVPWTAQGSIKKLYINILEYLLIDTDTNEPNSIYQSLSLIYTILLKHREDLNPQLISQFMNISKMTLQSNNQEDLSYINTLGVISTLMQLGHLKSNDKTYQQIQKRFLRDHQQAETLNYIRQNPLAILSLETAKNTNPKIFEEIKNLIEKLNQKS